jgi:hypothetical protein
VHVYGAQRLPGCCIRPLTAAAALWRKTLILLRLAAV